MINFDGFSVNQLDQNINILLEEHCIKYQISPVDAYKHWIVLNRRQSIKRFLAHAEMFKMTLDVPGDIVELGVFRGMGLMTWANLLESYCIGDRTKVVYGFDNWRGFINIQAEDGAEDEQAHKIVGGFSPKNYYEELQDAIKIFDLDRFIPQKPRIKLINGNIEETIFEFVEQNKGLRFSLIHFDCDLYAPTKAGLTALWPLLSRGGVMIFDEYGISQWQGETLAVDEFFNDKPEVRLKTLPWTNTPAAYLIK